MSLRCGIIGLPNVGKSTLFNALTESQAAEASNYPFCTIEPNLGTIIVPDSRLNRIAEIYNSKKIIPATVEFIDIAGLVQGASKGEGLGNKFLSHIREVDAIIHIVRCYDDNNIIHVNGKINPVADIEIVESELILKDIETIDKRIEKISKNLKAGEKKYQAEYDLCIQLREHLNQSRLAKYFIDKLVPDQKFLINELNLLTDKPVLYVANVNDYSEKENYYTKSVLDIASKENTKFIILSVKLESDIANLETIEEKNEFITALNLKESGLNKLLHESYSMLNLITFFTANERESHAWTIGKGTKAQQAAGKIHTDFEKGFIKAEVIKYHDIIEFGTEHAIKEKGLLKIEGKDYIVVDGDIIFFRFNV